MDENLQNKHISSIFHRPYSLNMVFECVLENKTSTWTIYLSFFQVMIYVDLVYD
jgi:hypothetical protein